MAGRWWAGDRESLVLSLGTCHRVAGAEDVRWLKARRPLQPGLLSVSRCDLDSGWPQERGSGQGRQHSDYSLSFRTREQRFQSQLDLDSGL